jgi:hypothetical protein
MQKIAGILFSIGAFVAILGEFRPIIFNVFGASAGNLQLQAQYIENDPAGWAVAHLLMGAGSLIAAFGVVLFARQVQSLSQNRNVRIISNVSAGMALVGALFWALVAYNRVASTPQEVVANMGAANWMEWAYFLITEIALILVGFVLLRTDYPKWLAWLVLVLGGLMLIASFSGGGVPLFHSILYVILGIALLLMRSHSPQLLPSVT